MERISDFFQKDHREIDALLADVPFEVHGAALASFDEFDRRLERHIEWEEGILFPAVAQKAPPIEAGPIRVMKFEHQEIRRCKAAARKALQDGDGGRARDHVDEMLRILGEHNLKEERILYPACDQLLPEDEAAGVMKRVRAAS